MATDEGLEQKLMEELETHVRRILEHWDPKKGHELNLDVMQMRSGFVNALNRLIDHRVQQRLSEQRPGK